MGLDTIPIEALFQITSHLGLKDLLSLSRTSRCHNTLLEPMLYRSIRRRILRKPGFVESLAKNLVGNQRLAPTVRELGIPLTHTKCSDPSVAFQVSQILGACSNIEWLELYREAKDEPSTPSTLRASRVHTPVAGL